MGNPTVMDGAGPLTKREYTKNEPYIWPLFIYDVYWELKNGDKIRLLPGNHIEKEMFIEALIPPPPRLHHNFIIVHFKVEDSILGNQCEDVKVDTIVKEFEIEINGEKRRAYKFRLPQKITHDLIQL